MASTDSLASVSKSALAEANELKSAFVSNSVGCSTFAGSGGCGGGDCWDFAAAVADCINFFKVAMAAAALGDWGCSGAVGFASECAGADDDEVINTTKTNFQLLTTQIELSRLLLSLD